MRKTRSRSFPVLLMTLAFFAGLIYFIVNLYVHSSSWSSMPQNGHLSDGTGLEHAGTITDRNGVVLAHSVDGQRLYNDDEQIRRACLHVVGDDSVNIGTAIQTVYRSEISGYNFVFGLGAPKDFQNGAGMTLTIDSAVQKAAYQALGSNRGAVVVYNYKTGEIICLVSTPTYDPQYKPEDIETNDAYEGAYLNRALSSTYPPGSTFKLITAAAALESIDDVENRKYMCTGSENIGGKEISCVEASGEIDFAQALMYSCNCYFAHLSLELGKDKMTTKAELEGFNKNLIIDGIETATSKYDVTCANENELAWSGVGQYNVMETPINMAVRSAAIANGGTPVMPRIVRHIDGIADPMLNIGSAKTGQAMMSPSVAQKLSDMMERTVNEYYGKYYVSDRLTVCAKTGTAEVGNGKPAHAWVTGFSKDEDCPLAFSVIVENGNSGYQAAIPVASAAINAAADALRSAS